MNSKEYEELKSEVKKVLDHLTYDEQEKIINLVQRMIAIRDYEKNGYEEIDYRQKVDQLIEKLPCSIGDEAWAFKHRTKTPARKGRISEMFFTFSSGKIRFYVVVYGIGRGELGKDVFLNEDEAIIEWNNRKKRR